MKFALLSHILPPTWSGQTVMLYRILRGFDPGDYCLVSRVDYAPGAFQGGDEYRLPARYYHLPVDARLTRGSRFGLWRAREGLNVPVGVVSRARKVARIIRREGCGAVVACTGDLFDPPAAYLASRMAGVPFYFYVFDYYSEQNHNAVWQFYARRFEPFLMRGAKCVITHNELMRDELRRRYGAEVAVVYNPCDLSDYESPPEAGPVAHGGAEVRIVYTGAVYEAHYDAFRNLVGAIGRLTRPGVRLHLYSGSPVDWEAEGISGPVVRHGYQQMSAVPAIQRAADILFLPLAFESPYPVLINTSAPSKMGEYLAARRPVLVHAPKDSFLARYFREHECGLVVDESDPARLAEAVQRLIGDADLRRRLVENAWARAQADFSVGASREAFARALGLSGARRG
ncbi:MAG TPA: glycosyltransferase family 4 protein [Pyrinomonadaceae bacterium]|nr:glycosyltransferase family 4 protein [Pyrinomonadaceae bacterium]